MSCRLTSQGILSSTLHPLHIWGLCLGHVIVWRYGWGFYDKLVFNWVCCQPNTQTSIWRTMVCLSSGCYSTDMLSLVGLGKERRSRWMSLKHARCPTTSRRHTTTDTPLARLLLSIIIFFGVGGTEATNIDPKFPQCTMFLHSCCFSDH